MATQWWNILGLLLVTLTAETLHARKVLKGRRLIFVGHGRRIVSPETFVVLTGMVRTLAMAGLAWSLLVLLSLPSRKLAAQKIPEGQAMKRVVFMLDVSPSMDIEDSGPTRQARAARASTAISSLLGQLDLSRVRLSLIPFYSGAMPIIVDTTDANIIQTMSSGLPLYSAFEPGSTRLSRAMEEAFTIFEKWEPGSTTLIILTDGDGDDGMLPRGAPASIGRAIVGGFGNVEKGTFIDNHLSRQNAPALRLLAQQLRGSYLNLNEMTIPTDLTESISGTFTVQEPPLTFATREVALLVMSISAGGLLLLQLLTLLFNSFVTRPGGDLA